jgi:hypothetical protein
MKIRNTWISCLLKLITLLAKPLGRTIVVASPAGSIIDELLRCELRVDDPANAEEIAGALRDQYPTHEDRGEAGILLKYDLDKKCLKDILIVRFD